MKVRESLCAYVRSPAHRLPNEMEPALQSLYVLLRDRSGHDFSLYKASTIVRRTIPRSGLREGGRRERRVGRAIVPWRVPRPVEGR